jgi:DNA polymerase-3 subunit gamma/tau
VSTAVALELEPVAQSSGEISCDELRNAVLTALEDAGQHVLAHNLEEGEWSVRGGEVAVKVGMSQVLIDVALGPEPKRIMQAALSKAANRPLKFKMVSGTPAVAAKSDQAPRPVNGVGARSRAMSDPLVQRMQEKFGAEIRTVIDQKERG